MWNKYIEYDLSPNQIKGFVNLLGMSLGVPRQRMMQDKVLTIIEFIDSETGIRISRSVVKQMTVAYLILRFFGSEILISEIAI